MIYSMIQYYIVLKKTYIDNHHILYHIWLVVFSHPSEKYDFVNWDDNRNPIFMGKCQKWQPNHQPVIRCNPSRVPISCDSEPIGVPQLSRPVRFPSGRRGIKLDKRKDKFHRILDCVVFTI